MKRSEMIDKLAEHLVLSKMYSDFNDKESFQINANIILTMLENEGMLPPEDWAYKNEWEPEDD